MFGLNFNKNKDEPASEEKQELEQFFEDEDWDIGRKGGEVDKDEEDIDWSNYDFMHSFDDQPESDRGQNEDEE